MTGPGTEPLEPSAGLNALLRPLAELYERDDTEEIAVVAPKVLFRRTRQVVDGRAWIETPADWMTAGYLSLVIEAVNNAAAVPRGATIYTEIIGESGRQHRFSAGVGPNIAHFGRGAGRATGFCMCIRQGPDLHSAAELSQWQVHTDTKSLDGNMRTVGRTPTGPYAQIYHAAQSNIPILISGPTGSGKTTILNMLMAETSPLARVITVEDTAEIQVAIRNHNHLFLTRGFETEEETPATPESRTTRLTTKMCVELIKRLSPDVIAVGEISPGNAGLALELLRTGHNAFWTTVHAENPDEAFLALDQSLRHTTSAEAAALDVERIKGMFCVIQVAKHRGIRRITHVRMPEGA